MVGEKHGIAAGHCLGHMLDHELAYQPLRHYGREASCTCFRSNRSAVAPLIDDAVAVKPCGLARSASPGRLFDRAVTELPCLLELLHRTVQHPARKGEARNTNTLERECRLYDLPRLAFGTEQRITRHNDRVEKHFVDVAFADQT